MLFKKAFLLILLFVVSLILTGCFSLKELDQQVIEKNQEFSDTVRENYGDDIEQAKDEMKDKALDATYDIADKSIKFMAKSITNSIKVEIDKWIKQNGLNQYGDSKDTMYNGGTPLFDEATGETKDKYEYILKNHPELVEKLGL